MIHLTIPKIDLPGRPQGMPFRVGFYDDRGLIGSLVTIWDFSKAGPSLLSESKQLTIYYSNAAKLAKARRELITPSGGGGGAPGLGFDVARTGIASVGFVGFPSVGKVCALEFRFCNQHL